MKKIALVALLLCSTGCFHITYKTNRAAQPSPADESWHHNFFWGLWEASPPVDVAKICPNGYAMVDYRVSFINGLADWVAETVATIVVQAIAGPGVSLPPIWSPSTVAVTCAATKAMSPAHPEREPVGMMSPAHPDVFALQ